MADISQIKLPDNTTYNIKDETARNAISDIIIADSVTIPSVTISSSGYVSIATYRPEHTGYNLLLATIYTYGSISRQVAVAVTGDGRYIFGTSGTTVTDAMIKYIFIKQ